MNMYVDISATAHVGAEPVPGAIAVRWAKPGGKWAAEPTFVSVASRKEVMGPGVVIVHEHDRAMIAAYLPRARALNLRLLEVSQATLSQLATPLCEGWHYRRRAGVPSPDDPVFRRCLARFWGRCQATACQALDFALLEPDPTPANVVALLVLLKAASVSGDAAAIVKAGWDRTPESSRRDLLAAARGELGGSEAWISTFGAADPFEGLAFPSGQQLNRAIDVFTSAVSGRIPRGGHDSPAPDAPGTRPARGPLGSFLVEAPSRRPRPWLHCQPALRTT